MVFHWSLSESKSPQVSRTRLRILAILSNAVVWIVSTRPPTSKSSRPFNNPLVIVPNAPITIGTIVTFMFPQLFQFSSKVEVLSLLSPFLQIYSVVHRDSKVESFADSLFFLLIIMRSGLLAGIRWSICMLLLLLLLLFPESLLKCKSTIQLATFNVKTFDRIGQLPELTGSAIDHNVVIALPDGLSLEFER